MQKATSLLRNTSDLRKLLVDTLADFKSNKLSVADARTVVKLTATVVRSLDVDLAAQRLALEHNLPMHRIGELPLTIEEDANV